MASERSYLMMALGFVAGATIFPLLPRLQLPDLISDWSKFLPALLGRRVGSTLQRTSGLDRALAELKAHFPPKQVSSDVSTLLQYGTSWGSISPPTPPSIVIHAETTEDVVKCVEIASKYNVVIIPVAGRTSLEGQFLPPSCCAGANLQTPCHDVTSGLVPSKSRPTIHLSLSRMDKIHAVHSTDFQAIVGPGVGWQSLNAYLEGEGIPLFFPVDPAPGSQFGGMVGVGGSGTNAVGYGTMRAEWIQGMEVVLMNGKVIRTRGYGRSRKSSTGWDVGRLFMGSEGTLGIITELTVRLAPVLPLKVALTSFNTVSQAVQAAVAILATGLLPTSLELLDGMSIRGLNLAQLLPKQLEEQPTLLLRLSGQKEVLDAALKTVAGIVKSSGGKELKVAQNEKENEEIWKARKNQFWSQQLLIGEGCRTLITDVCVPISRLAEFVEKSDVFVEESGLLAPIVAHIGDGNVHRAILFRPEANTSSAPPAVEALAARLSNLAIDLQGTCAGEHGIGTTKRKYLRKELGQETLDLMRTIKEVMDPKGLLNPGKILFEQDDSKERNRL